MISGLKRKYNNIVGNTGGYSGCAHCGDTWNWKKIHSIPYNDRGSGMFPVCDECYKKLSPQERYDYCRALWRSWNSPGKDIDWDKIKEYVGLTK